MFERILDDDPITGTRQIFCHDPYEGVSTIITQQNVEPILERNKYVTNAAPGDWKGDWHRVASIPMSLYYDLIRQGIIDDKNDPQRKKLRAWLNDRDNQLFRTRPGRV